MPSNDPREDLASRLRLVAIVLLSISVLRIDTQQGILGSVSASLVLILGDRSFLATVQRVLAAGSSSGRCDVSGFRKIGFGVFLRFLFGVTMFFSFSYAALFIRQAARQCADGDHGNARAHIHA